MSNVNHRYSSESWTLDLTGKRSPLSRWTGQDVLRDEQFRLSLLGAEGGVAPVVWLSGDRACFEDLHRAIEAYVQQGLSQPVLAGKSTFPAGSPGNAANSQFSLEAKDLLRHSLNYQPGNSSPRQMQLSMLQLADLLAVLDQWQNQTLALPEQPSRLKVLPGGKGGDFVIPTWGRIAASVVVALGATGIGAYILSQNLPSQQIALESAPAEADPEPSVNPSFGAAPNTSFGQFPTASGPPITSQAENGDAPFNTPLVLPKDAEASTPTTVLPLPSSSSGGLTPIPLPQPPPPLAGSSPAIILPPQDTASGDITIASGDITADAGIDPSATFPDIATFPVNTTPASEPELSDDDPEAIAEAPSWPEPTPEDGPLFANEPTDVPVAQNGTFVEETFADERPPLIQQPNPELAQAPVQTASDLATSAKIATSDAESDSANEVIVTAPATASRAGQPIGEVEPEAESIATSPAAAPVAPPAPQVIVSKPLPANNQSRAVQNYLQSQWNPPTTIQDALQYRLSISPEGNVASVEALSPTARLYMNDASLPEVGSAIIGAADEVQSTMVVTLTPKGRVNVEVETTIPAP